MKYIMVIQRSTESVAFMDEMNSVASDGYYLHTFQVYHGMDGQPRFVAIMARDDSARPTNVHIAEKVGVNHE